MVIDDAQASLLQPFGKATRVIQHCCRRGVAVDIVTTEPGFAAAVLGFPDGKLGLVLP